MGSLVLSLFTYNISSVKNKLEKENALLEKPLLITPDVRVIGNSIADLKFVVKNPSHSLDYYYLSGTCSPDNPEIFSSIPLNAESIQKEKISNDQLSIKSNINEDIKIPAGEEITLYCNNNYVKNVVKDLITNINVCVSIKGISNPICNQMQVTILRN